MSKFSETNLFGMTIRESANDGSDFTNPDADYRRLFVGEDGLFHLKDSAGTVTTPAQGALTNPMTTKGDVILGDTGGTPTRLGAGTSGYVLTSNGAAAFPSWQAGGGGGGGALVLVEQHTASSSATLDFTTCISSTYDEYLIEILALAPATNGAVLTLRCSTDGGSTYDTSGIYDYSELHTLWAGAATSIGANNGTSIPLFSDGAGTGLSSSATPAFVGTFRLFDPLSTANYKMLLGSGYGVYSATSGRYQFSTTAQYRSTTAVNAFRLLMTSGNIAAGTIRVYGIAK